MRGRDQCIKQGRNVLHLGRLAQIDFLGLLRGDMQCAQLVLHYGQAVALARQHHDLAGLEAIRNLCGKPTGGLSAFQRAQGFLGDFARNRQAVTPVIHCFVFLRNVGGAQDLRQLEHGTRFS